MQSYGGRKRTKKQEVSVFALFCFFPLNGFLMLYHQLVLERGNLFVTVCVWLSVFVVENELSASENTHLHSGRKEREKRVHTVLNYYVAMVVLSLKTK